jgi:hypothetical protein
MNTASESKKGDVNEFIQIWPQEIIYLILIIVDVIICSLTNHFGKRKSPHKAILNKFLAINYISALYNKNKTLFHRNDSFFAKN